MIRNILYALFLHLIIALLFNNYLDFRQYDTEYEDQEIGILVAVSKESVSSKETKKHRIVKNDKITVSKIEYKKHELKKNKSFLKKGLEKQDVVLNQKKIEPKKNIKNNINNLVEKKKKVEIKQKKITKELNHNSIKKERTISGINIKNLDIIENSNNTNKNNLSNREKFTLKSQLRRCYRIALSNSKNYNDLSIIIHATIRIDGTIAMNLEKSGYLKKYNNIENKQFRATIDDINNALKICSPLRNLPINKFHIWHNIQLNFIGDNII